MLYLLYTFNLINMVVCCIFENCLEKNNNHILYYFVHMYKSKSKLCIALKNETNIPHSV